MSSGRFPLLHGTPDQFAALRGLLERAGFTEEGICQRLGIAKLLDLQGPRLVSAVSQPIDVLLRLFMECEPVERSTIQTFLGSSAIELLNALGLLSPDASGGETYSASVVLCPTRSLYVASDRGAAPASLPEDAVYPALLEKTQQFLDILPPFPCQRFLDLGTGTGIAALVAASNYAAQAWACDITARSAHFAEFNRRLNGLENVRVLRGDLYEPVEDLTFDRIAIHPPYVPAWKQTWLFRDGGQDGEQVLRRAVAGLPRFLRPGGRFYAITLGFDREGEPFEAHIRKWLGEGEAEFDVVLITHSVSESADFLGRTLRKMALPPGLLYLRSLFKMPAPAGWRLSPAGPRDLLYLNNLFSTLKVQHVVYGAILIQRKMESRPPVTARVQKGPRSGLAETEWLLASRAEFSKPDGLRLLLGSRLSLSPHLRVAVRHRVQGGALAPEELTVRVQHPFESEIKCPSWVAGLIVGCDGNATGWEHFERLKSQQALPGETTAEEFAQIVGALVSSGFLLIGPAP